ncbi:hypothetical protein EIN_425120 [Entamoeba invadens IP1]|uniref:Uncharacterized protein n=1 Tax=Entamoeba invadens IP1 TaxID=370355 RepID=A0A0A1U635_ENTIV|nr:hypothetical protein EIN_425120 [Entamoeba invadens IP1]ELP89790.1 hypothetical protein EIN_425120 [Entamoeba invadens IP1]|eukprot:XP_004256561.1 hypothetical protein EIN_425120 [Entamoeba invadens IP1]
MYKWVTFGAMTLSTLLVMFGASPIFEVNEDSIEITPEPLNTSEILDFIKKDGSFYNSMDVSKTQDLIHEIGEDSEQSQIEPIAVRKENEETLEIIEKEVIQEENSDLKKDQLFENEMKKREVVIVKNEKGDYELLVINCVVSLFIAVIETHFTITIFFS